MGIDFHSLNWPIYAASRKAFGNVASLGRPEIYATAAEIKTALGSPIERDYGKYGEQLLVECFGARDVDSYDNSSYEGATHVLDFNEPIATERRYDTVLDLGCLEHIYNVPQALENISILAAEGGQIVHMLAANNQCGHGFWQFSPELFFAVYSEGNGYLEAAKAAVRRFPRAVDLLPRLRNPHQLSGRRPGLAKVEISMSGRRGGPSGGFGTGPRRPS